MNTRADHHIAELTNDMHLVLERVQDFMTQSNHFMNQSKTAWYTPSRQTSPASNGQAPGRSYAPLANTDIVESAPVMPSSIGVKVRLGAPQPAGNLIAASLRPCASESIEAPQQPDGRPDCI